MTSVKFESAVLEHGVLQLTIEYCKVLEERLVLQDLLAKCCNSVTMNNFSHMVQTWIKY